LRTQVCMSIQLGSIRLMLGRRVQRCRSWAELILRQSQHRSGCGGQQSIRCIVEASIQHQGAMYASLLWVRAHWDLHFSSVYAKPLLFTPESTAKQLIFLASSMNYIRTLDAVTGNLINSRQVQTPFLQSDIGCTVSLSLTRGSLIA
jgi:hypothetical protein